MSLKFENDVFQLFIRVVRGARITLKKPSAKIRDYVKPSFAYGMGVEIGAKKTAYPKSPFTKNLTNTRVSTLYERKTRAERKNVSTTTRKYAESDRRARINYFIMCARRTYNTNICKCIRRLGGELPPGQMSFYGEKFNRLKNVVRPSYINYYISYAFPK